MTGKTDDLEVSEVKTISLMLPPLNITVKFRYDTDEMVDHAAFSIHECPKTSVKKSSERK